MKYFSLFSGVGGFENAIHSIRPVQQEDSEGSGEHNDTEDELQQWECVGYSEIDKYAIKIYQHHYPQHKNYGNIKEINWNTVPDFDLLVGGSPCQDLSIAGKRAGLDGERSGLFTEYVRCLQEKKPTHFIWENVRGALSSNQGWDFVGVINSFTEAGYDVQWQVLNSKDFGVPQNRERIFVVGTRGGSRPEVFPFTGTNAKDIIQINRPKHSNDRIYSDGGGKSNTKHDAGWQ